MNPLSFDEPQWIRFDVPGVGRVDVTEPLTWNGVYRSVTMAELDQIATAAGGAPLTKAIADAAWSGALTRVVPPLMSAVSEVDHDQASQDFTSALLAKRISGPAYVDLGAKDWILDELDASTATNYGLRGSAGNVAQPVRLVGDPRRHNWGHRDWSQLARLWRAPGGGPAMSSIASSLGASDFAAGIVAQRWHGPVALPDAPTGGAMRVGGDNLKRNLALVGAAIAIAYAMGWL